MVECIPFRKEPSFKGVFFYLLYAFFVFIGWVIPSDFYAQLNARCKINLRFFVGKASATASYISPLSVGGMTLRAPVRGRAITRGSADAIGISRMSFERPRSACQSPRRDEGVGSGGGG